MGQISKSINDAINQQAAKELYNANLYRYIASWFSNKGLENLANHFLIQSEDEISHSRRFQDYLNNRIGGDYHSLQVDTVDIEINNITDIGEIYQNQECDTTANIEQLIIQSETEKDYLTRELLTWYINEQQAEENEAFVFKQQVDMIGENFSSLVLFDKTFVE